MPYQEIPNFRMNIMLSLACKITYIVHVHSSLMVTLQVNFTQSQLINNFMIFTHTVYRVFFRHSYSKFTATEQSHNPRGQFGPFKLRGIPYSTCFLSGFSGNHYLTEQCISFSVRFTLTLPKFLHLEIETKKLHIQYTVKSMWSTQQYGKYLKHPDIFCDTISPKMYMHTVCNIVCDKTCTCICMPFHC